MKKNKELHILLIMIAITFIMTLGLILLDPLSAEMTADIGRQIILTEYLPFTIYSNVVNSFNSLGENYYSVLIAQGKIKSIIISFVIAFSIIFSFEVFSLVIKNVKTGRKQMNKYNELPKLINKENKIEGKKRNPFKTIIIIQVTAFALLLSNFIILPFFLDNNVINYKALHTIFPFIDTFMYVLYISLALYLSLLTAFLASALYLKIRGVDNVNNIPPLMLIFASKIYKKKTGKELTGSSYKELVAKLDRAGMIEKPRSIIDYEIEEVEKEITEAKAKLEKLEAKKNKK